MTLLYALRILGREEDRFVAVFATEEEAREHAGDLEGGVLVVEPVIMENASWRRAS